MFEIVVFDLVEFDELFVEVIDVNFIILKWIELKSNGVFIIYYMLYYKKLIRDDKLVEGIMVIDNI